MTTNSEHAFAKTDRNQVRRVPARGVYDREAVFRILDASPIGHVSFTSESGPCTIPMFFARCGDALLFHGATKSRLLQILCSGQDICFSVATVDGLVLAKSLFHHSMNYRSVTAFGRGRCVVDEDERMQSLKVMTDKIMPGRWEDSRRPSVQEMKATQVASVTIESASAKIRTGGPVDDPEDAEFPCWSGVIPTRDVAGAAVPDDHTKQAQIAIPSYMQSWSDEFNA